MISVQREGNGSWFIQYREDRQVQGIEIMELEPAATVVFEQGLYIVSLASYGEVVRAVPVYTEWRPFRTLREAIDAVAVHLAQQRKAS